MRSNFKRILLATDSSEEAELATGVADRREMPGPPDAGVGGNDGDAFGRNRVQSPCDKPQCEGILSMNGTRHYDAATSAPGRVGNRSRSLWPQPVRDGLLWGGSSTGTWPRDPSSAGFRPKSRPSIPGTCCQISVGL